MSDSFGDLLVKLAEQAEVLSPDQRKQMKEYADSLGRSQSSQYVSNVFKSVSEINGVEEAPNDDRFYSRQNSAWKITDYPHYYNLTSQVTGSATAFTLTEPTANFTVFKNGLELHRTDDFNAQPANLAGFNLKVAPLSGDTIEVLVWPQSTGFGAQTRGGVVPPAAAITPYWESITNVNDGQIYASYLYNDVLYIGGNFENIGTLTNVLGFATYNTVTGVWDDLGGIDGSGLVYSITGDGAGNVYVGGYFDGANGVVGWSLIKWTGSVWLPVGDVSGHDINNTIYDMQVVGTKLYIAGNFSNAGGVAEADGVAYFDTSDNLWHAVGVPGTGTTANAVAVYGSNVYLGGGFSQIAGVTNTGKIAWWNGAAWVAMGTGLSANVYALEVDSAGNLYAGGNFTNAGGVAEADYIARWNGSAWVAVGTGTSGIVYTITQDSIGNVYVGGLFATAGGVTANNVAKWSGSVWSSFIGTNGVVTTLTVSSARDLYIGGYYTTAGGLTTKYASYIVSH